MGCLGKYEELLLVRRLSLLADAFRWIPVEQGFFTNKNQNHYCDLGTFGDIFSLRLMEKEN